MFRQFRTVSMMLLLLGGSTGAVYAANPDVAGMYDTQQSSVCKGVVNDAFGPVIGASVVVKGSTNGVITDIDGNFSLSGVKEGDIIQISFVGYKTVEQAWNGKPLNHHDEGRRRNAGRGCCYCLWWKNAPFQGYQFNFQSR